MPRYTEQEARWAVAASISWSETLRRLGMRPAGGNHGVLRHWVDDVWRIPTDHFDPNANRNRYGRRAAPLEEVMVAGSTYSRATLKRRLFREGIKERRCEQCGQGEIWRGTRMALILDHINGVPNDNRLENLRIVCPNCAATLDTHCGRKNRKVVEPRSCLLCGCPFTPKYSTHRYCSRRCGQSVSPQAQRRVARPPYEQLMAEIEAMGYSAVGRKCGVSDNAIRKWVRAYERERNRGGGDAGGPD